MPGPIQQWPGLVCERDPAVWCSWPSRRLAVVPAWTTGRERTPGSSLGIVFLPVEQQHVVTQQDQRVGARTRSGDMAMVVHVPGRDQGRYVATDQGTLLHKAQVGPVVVL